MEVISDWFHGLINWNQFGIALWLAGLAALALAVVIADWLSRRGR